MIRRKHTDADLIGAVEPYRLLPDEDAYNPENILDQIEVALHNNFDVRANGMLDEKQIPRYANFYEFARRGLNLEPFPRQLQLIMHAHGEICMFCSDPEMAINMLDQDMNTIFEKVVFMRHCKCPKCGRTRLDMLKNRLWFYPNRIALLVGQRGGKNMTLAMESLYQDHLYLTLEKDGKRVSPFEYYGLLPTFVRQAFTGVTAQQAFDNIWAQIVSVRNNSPWYKQYFEFLDYHGKRMGQELYKVSDTFVSYNHKRMGSTIKTPDKRKLRGATRYFTAIDEICWFNSTLSESAEKKVGDVREVWVSLNNSLRTIRNEADRLIKSGVYDCPNAYSMDISSPYDVNDILSQMLREAKSNPRILAGHYATWEFNPRYTRESLAEEFVKDPEVAWRDFGAIPPLANQPWISEPKSVINVVRKIPDPVYMTYKVRQERNTYGDVTQWFELDRVNLAGAGRIIAIDNGLSNNAFACCIGSIEAGGKTRIDTAVMMKPSTMCKINLDKMFTEFVLPLTKKCNAVMVVYDHWNSIQNVQHLRDLGYMAKQHTLTGNNFNEMRAAIFSGTISYPFTEYGLNPILDRSADVDLIQTAQDKPNFSLVLQTLTVREVSAGKVVKPKYGDDDVFRTAALIHAMIADPENAKLLLKGGMVSGQQAAPRGSVIVRGISAGGSFGARPGVASRGLSGGGGGGQAAGAGVAMRGLGGQR